MLMEMTKMIKKGQRKMMKPLIAEDGDDVVGDEGTEKRRAETGGKKRDQFARREEERQMRMALIL